MLLYAQAHRIVVMAPSTRERTCSKPEAQESQNFTDPGIRMVPLAFVTHKGSADLMSHVFYRISVFTCHVP